MTLTDFLLARIAEDEAEAAQWPDDGKWGVEPESGAMWLDPTGRPIYAPRSRVLAECEAKRRIVEAFTPFDTATPQQVYTSRLLFSLLALPYADHPDYREEWKP